MAGIGQHGDPNVVRQALEPGAPGPVHRVDGRTVEIGDAVEGLADHDDLDRDAGDRRVRQLVGRQVPVEILGPLDEVERWLEEIPPCRCLVGRQHRHDPLEQVGVEGIDENDPGDLGAVGIGEDSGVDAAERVGDDEERWLLTRGRQQGAEVGCDVGGRVPASRFAPSEPGSVVRARPRPLAQRRQDEAPAGCTAAHAGLEDDGR